MGELTAEIHHRLEEATASLRLAEQTGDDYFADVRHAEIEELQRIAIAHDIELDIELDDRLRMAV
jgi:hypothetical protein